MAQIEELRRWIGAAQSGVEAPARLFAQVASNGGLDINFPEAQALSIVLLMISHRD
jgi:hypothetical protein